MKARLVAPVVRREAAAELSKCRNESTLKEGTLECWIRLRLKKGEMGDD